MLITSKGDGEHFYGYEYEGAKPIEIRKVHGWFYRCKLVLGEGLIIQGEPLKDFILVND